MQNGRETDPAVERWAGAGHSDHSDPGRAGEEAVAEAISGENPRLVLVFASPRYSFDALAHAARRAAGPAELIGGASAHDGVRAFALGGRGFSVATAAESLAGADSRAAGEQVARGLAELDSELAHRALIVITDGQAGDSHEVVRGAYSVAGATVSLVGGSTGLDGRGGNAMLLHDHQLPSGSVVAAALASEAPFGVGVRHGMELRGGPLLVTASRGATVETLNDRPALDTYLEAVAAPPEAGRDHEAFSALALRRPFGVAAARGREAQVRSLTGVDFESRSLRCSGELPAGTLVWLMAGEGDHLLDATVESCYEALAPLDDRPPLGLLAFDSVARAELLGAAGAGEERASIDAAAGGAPTVAVPTFGEIARTRGFAGFHSHAVALLAIA
jgi:hypothetical protein